VDPREGRSEQLTRNVVEGIERDDRVERLRCELDRSEVGDEEFSIRHRRTRAPHLFGRDVHARHLKPRSQTLRLGHTCAATELQHAGRVMQSGHELVLPLAARIADDLVAPLGKSLADRVVASTNKLDPRIGHSTVTFLFHSGTRTWPGRCARRRR
jgi:hypothetical protein